MTLHVRQGVTLLALIPAMAGAQSTASRTPLAMSATNLQAGDERHRAIATSHGGQVPTLPGDTLRYRLTFTNVRADSVRNVQFDDPLPAGLQYVPGTAQADRSDVEVAFSIDGGKSYSPQPMVTRIANGRRVQEAAPASQYTHVRWTLRGWVLPGAQVTAAFNAHLSTDRKITP